MTLSRCGRRTDPSDSRLADLDRRCFEEPWSRESYAALFRNPHVAAWLLADEAGAEVGFLCFQLVGDEAELFRIGICPEHRRAGRGRALLERLLDHLRRQGARRVFLDVHEGNAPALALYRAAGFRCVSRRQGYYRRPPGDALVLEREL